MFYGSACDSLLSADPKTDMIMVGDSNDEPDNESIRDHLRAVKTADRMPGGSLLDTTAPIKDAKKGTERDANSGLWAPR